MLLSVRFGSNHEALIAGGWAAETKTGLRWFAPQDKLSSTSLPGSQKKACKFLKPETFICSVVSSSFGLPLWCPASFAFSSPFPLLCPRFFSLPVLAFFSSSSFYSIISVSVLSFLFVLILFSFSLLNFLHGLSLFFLLLSSPNLSLAFLALPPLSSLLSVSLAHSLPSLLSLFLELASVVSAGTLYQMHLVLTPNWRLPWELNSSRSLSLGRNLLNPWLLLPPARGHHIPELAPFSELVGTMNCIPALTPLTFLAKSKSDRKPLLSAQVKSTLGYHHMMHYLLIIPLH